MDACFCALCEESAVSAFKIKNACYRNPQPSNSNNLIPKNSYNNYDK